jgi:DNA-binding MltR family transcriptional regulator
MAKPKQLSPEDLRAKWQGLFDALTHQTDSVCAIVGIAYVDHCLGSLLGLHFIEGETANAMLDSSGPIGSFLNKAKCAYCLGIISKGCFNNLALLAEIRNRFAHKLDVLSFDHESVASDCKKLTMPSKLHLNLPRESDIRDMDDMIDFVNQHLDSSTNRGRFSMIVATVGTDLILKSWDVKKVNRLKDQWD